MAALLQVNVSQADGCSQECWDYSKQMFDGRALKAGNEKAGALLKTIWAQFRWSTGRVAKEEINLFPANNGELRTRTR